MAERDMTGEERPGAVGPLGLPREPELPALADLTEDVTPGLARRLGRVGFENLEADLAGLAGGAGDIANLPPWSVRGDRATAGERPDRDPVALAAWRRVAERRRLRAAGGSVDVPTGGDAAPMAAVSASPSDDPEQPVSVDPAPVERALEPAVPEAVDVDGTAAAPAERLDLHLDLDSDPADLLRPGGAASDDPDLSVPRADDEERPVLSWDRSSRDEATDDPGSDDGEPDDEADDEAGDVVDGPATPAARDAHGRPPERRSGAPAARGGDDSRPGTPPPPRPDAGGRHEVLLSLAGRIDDDALTSVRELVAVEDDAAAAELLGGCLLAAGAGVTAREHAVLGRWFAASRVDPELIDVLPRDPEADRREDHRFTADPPTAGAASGGAGEVVARAAARLPGVHRVRQSWRTTPAGSAPGPVPHRVVLVETRSADDCEHVAHHVAHAARELGAVSVEVFAAGAELPAYHRAAVRAARPLGTAPSPAEETAPLIGGPSAPGTRAGAAPEPAPSWPRRGGDEVPPFGVPTPSAGLDAAAGTADAPADEPAPAERDPAAGDDQYRTVAEAGRDPLERTGRVETAEDDEELTAPVRPAPGEAAARAARASRADRIERVDRAPRDAGGSSLWSPSAPAGPTSPVGRGESTSPRSGSPGPEGPAEETTGRRARREDEPDVPDADVAAGSPAGPASPPTPPTSSDPLPDELETVAPEEPAPLDLDPGQTAERIAALWRTPPPDEILSDQHPISAWSEGPVAPTFGPGADEPATTAVPDAPFASPADAPGPVDPDAATGDMPAVRAEEPPAAGGGRRSRHSRNETGELAMPVEPGPGAGPGPAPTPPPIPPRTNGHHHGAEDPGGSREPATGPMPRPGATPEPGPPPRPAASSSGPDTFDSQLSERERELLARLHEELASRERLEADAPDPLLGHPGQQGRPPQAPNQPPNQPPPGSEDTTAPRPRPTGPPPGPGHPAGPPPGPAGTNGTGANGHHGPVNGHGLPRRRDHDDEDGPPPSA
ncbi:hypothetical protein Acsp06_54760 [Actinomycetospora sp. NBRC 106375]|uniref:hypothetical protein n=1 Tax=Actinomycetospora sp. NBRC 106375 TaxID=3032207 RepID=UPI0024A5776F|nr:hypothetical protein [Actinomycetospora sp. NBRC 106375]GLZ49291.1 hypothetical protein Acsp06_54760 [Actinomycetospora sp. NBRC 106375]